MEASTLSKLLWRWDWSHFCCYSWYK